MPLKVPQHQLDEIVRHIGQHEQGLAVAALLDALGHDAPDLTRRTLQRRLARLVEEGRLRAVGEGRGRRYVAHLPSPLSPPHDLRLQEDPEDESYGEGSAAWLSPESRQLRAQLRRPITERRPVGYHTAFLDDYLPNSSFYLPAEMRAELAEIGRVGATDLPAGTYTRQILGRLLIDLSWNSSRLEGNTYSLLETERLLQLGEMVDGKKAREAQMILNHKAAIELLADPAAGAGMNRYTLCNLHALLADNLLPDPDAGGRPRDRAVGISGSVFLPLDVPGQIEACFDLILEKAAAIEDPFEQAFFTMVHLPYLQPFEDVNKRVSRIAANIPLVGANLCPLSFTDVPQEDYIGAVLAVYEMNRVDYLRDLFAWAYRRSAERFAAVRGQLGEPDPFRLKHRSIIRSLVRTAVTDRLHGGAYEAWLDAELRKLLDLTPAEWERLREVISIELAALHDGNIARYRLRPAELAAWEAAGGGG